MPVYTEPWGDAMRDDFEARWHEEAEEVISGMKEWRLQHPRATLREIEQALDERLGKMRARLLRDAALASAAADLASTETGARLRCPECEVELQDRGVQERRLTTHQEQVVRLERHYGVCPQCGAGFFPPG
jgi:RNA polymerase-binding transcription factor DksA